MTETAPLVVIGGGIMGSSITYFLAAGGMPNVVLLEADSVGAGITGKSAALVRMHYPDPRDTALAVKSLEAFQNWGEMTGGDCGYVGAGFLFIVGPWDVANLRHNVSMVRAHGGRTEVLGPEEIKELQPWFAVGDIGAAAYEPDSGYADGYLAATSLARRAAQLGAVVRQGCRATEIVVDEGRVKAVKTGQETIETPMAVLAAGPWSPHLARTAGLELPLTGMRVAAAILERPACLGEPHLPCIDRVIGTYFRPEGENLTLAGVGSRPGGPGYDPDDFPQKASPEERIATLRRMAQRIPAFAEAGWRDSFAAVESFTPDGHAILGPSPVEGLYLAVGLSGTGFKTAPAVGLGMAELVLEGRSRSVDLEPYRLSRFDEGKPISSDHDYTFGPLPED